MIKRGVKSKRGQMNISFGLIFAIVAGAFILFIAIYAVVKFTGLEDERIQGETSRTLAVLTNPLESSFESSRTITMTTSAETRIYTGCFFEEPNPNDPTPSSREYFGRQLINTSHKAHGKWVDATFNAGISNKYIFSENPSQGRKFYVFSKPFEFPYKIGDLIYILSTDKEYCFIDSDTVRNGDLEEEIENLNQPMLVVADEIEECSENSIKVCFRNHVGCDIRVDYLGGSLRKGVTTFQFETDALMFAAIFSDKSIYECQVNRLMQRAESLSDLYLEKNSLMTEQADCGQGIRADLLVFNSLLKNYRGLTNLNALETEANMLDRRNKIEECSLW